MSGTVLREVEIGAPAHGGHAVARHDGRVIFVRHAAPGELVDVALTEAAEDARFWRGDAVAVRRASPDRVPHVWPAAGPGGVGGAELGHLTLPAQRAWKQAVLGEALTRIGHLDLPAPAIEAVEGDDTGGGLHTRTRIELVADAEGRPAMFRHRSHDLIAVADMPLAAEELLVTGALGRTWRAGTRLDLVAPSASDAVVLQDGQPNRTVTEEVVAATRQGERRWRYRVAASGFWQVHRKAPSALVSAVLDAAEVAPGERVLELYSGVGLFTLPLADEVGPGGQVVAVEADPAAARLARRNAHAHPWVHLVGGDVRAVLRRRELPGAERPDVVVLDPPRAGAGGAVMSELTRLAPRRIVYVACDPASLARDLASATRDGYRVSSLRGFDLFPHTHHLETVAVLDRAGG